MFSLTSPMKFNSASFTFRESEQRQKKTPKNVIFRKIVDPNRKRDKLLLERRIFKYFNEYEEDKYSTIFSYLGSPKRA